MKFNPLLFSVGFFVPLVIWAVQKVRNEGFEGLLKNNFRMPFAREKKKAAAADPAADAKPAPPPSEATLAGTRVPEFAAGFRNARWGEPPNAEMSVLKNDGDEILYMRASDVMRLGEARLNAINYQFWRGKLAGVILQVAPGSLEKAIESLKGTYGAPPKQSSGKYYWVLSTHTHTMVDPDAKSHAGTVVIVSKAVSDERKSVESAENAGAGPIALGPGAPDTPQNT